MPIQVGAAPTWGSATGHTGGEALALTFFHEVKWAAYGSIIKVSVVRKRLSDMGKSGGMLLIFFTTVLFSGMVSAGNLQVYRWVDQHGILHYSDKAPTQPEPKVKRITLPALPASNPHAAAKDRAWIASINHWYQSVVKRQAQLQTRRTLIAGTAPASSPVMPVAAPLFWGYPNLGFRNHRNNRDFVDRARPGQAESPLFRPPAPNALPSTFTPDTQSSPLLGATPQVWPKP